MQIALVTSKEGAGNSSSNYVISDRGTIKMPMLEKEIPATGVTTAVLIRRINAAYKSAGIPNVEAINPSLASGGFENVVSVGGEVQATGEFPLRQGMTLMAAIKRAGGFNEFATASRVRLIRANKEKIYDLRKINPDGSNNPVLLDGDLIVVPGG